MPIASSVRVCLCLTALTGLAACGSAVSTGLGAGGSGLTDGGNDATSGNNGTPSNGNNGNNYGNASSSGSDPGSGTTSSSSSSSGGGGTACPSSCTQDSDCQNSCPAAMNGGINCCDTSSSTCFMSPSSTCGTPQVGSE
ncbi:MAG: hypothetical protein ACRENE_06210 [Polyangiaceae bacterium]